MLKYNTKFLYLKNLIKNNTVMETTKRALYVLKTHPYNEDVQNVKISGNPEYTSPVLNSFEEKRGKHDTETGKALGNQLHGIYYDSKNGKFIKKLINTNLVTKISFDLIDNPFFSEFKFEIESQVTIKEIERIIKNKYLNKKVSLRSISIELEKKKLNRSNSVEKLIETNHLDFLPPVMQIIGYRFSDEKKKFCEETGDLKLEFKCKWYNHISRGFSEEFLPYQTLILINELIEEKKKISGINDTINSNQLIQYPIPENEVFNLEGTPVKINFTIVEPQNIVF